MKRIAKQTSIILGFCVVAFTLWFWFLPNGDHPRTVDQAVEKLLSELSEDDLALVRSTPHEELGIFHMSLGMHIRNEFGFSRGNFRLLLSIGKLEAVHPDYASHHIVVALWEHLNSPAASKPAMASPIPLRVDCPH